MPFTRTNSVAVVRTLVPSLYGLAIAWLIEKVPAVGDILAWLSAELGTDVTAAIGVAVTGLIIAGYYWVARKIGERWPAVERWLLGSSLTPTYTKEGE